MPSLKRIDACDGRVVPPISIDNQRDSCHLINTLFHRDRLITEVGSNNGGFRQLTLYLNV